MTTNALLERVAELISQGTKPLDALVQARREALTIKQQKEPA